MRAVLGLLCFLSLTCNAASDPTPTCSAKLAAAEALLNEIASGTLDSTAEGLPDTLARAVETWTRESAEEVDARRG